MTPRGASVTTLEQAVAAVEATLDSTSLRVDRKRAREDAVSYLVLVLDTGGGTRDTGTAANGPRLVDKRSGDVTRLTVPDALARAERMAAAVVGGCGYKAERERVRHPRPQ